MFRGAARAILALFLTCFAGAAQAFNEFQARPLDLPEAYRNQYISLATEDTRGMIWFVTNSGLHRYDGNEVLSFDLQSKPALPALKIQALLADRQYRLWIACGSELLCFDLRAWTLEKIAFTDAGRNGTPEQQTTLIYECRDGRILAGTNSGRLYSFQTGAFRRLSLAADDIGSIRSAGEWGDQLWLGTNTGRLISYFARAGTAGKTRIHAPAAIQQEAISFIQPLAPNRVMLHSDETGNFLFDPATKQLLPVKIPAGLPQVRSASVFPASIDGAEVLFFFTQTAQAGIGIWDGAANAMKRAATASISAFKNPLFKVGGYRNGRLLLITEGGIVIVSRFQNPFDVFLTGIDQMNSIRTIFKDAAGRLLMSTYREGWLQLDEQRGTHIRRFEKLVEAAIPWSADSVLTACPEPRWYLPASNRFSAVFKNPADFTNLKTWSVNTLLRESDSTVWAGTYSGTYLFNPRSGRRIAASASGRDQFLEQKGVNAIARLGDKRFFGTHDGVYWCRPREMIFHPFFNEKDSAYRHATVNCIEPVGDKLWIGTNGYGILICGADGKILKAIGKAEGLADNVVYSLPQCERLILAGTGNGLSVLDAGAKVISSYTSREILPGNEFNRGAFLVRGDTVYMGTVNGLIRIDIPALKQFNGRRAAVYPTALSYVTETGIHNDYAIGYQEHPQIDVPAGAHAVTIRLGARPGNEDEIFYTLKQGSTPQSLGGQRTISFVELAPGTHELGLFQRDAGGKGLQELLHIPIHVAPLYYQTWWFRTLLALAVVALVIGVIRYRERVLRKEQALRRQIAGDLHDEIGSALTRIYLQTDALLSGTGVRDSGVLPALEKISGSSQEALSSMNDIVWSVDAEYDNAADLVSRMKDYLVKLREELDLDCVFSVSGDYEHRSMGQAVRQNIYLIFREGVNNALKHAPDRRLEIEAHFPENGFRLQLQNELSRAAPKLDSGGHGMRSMQHRAAKIRAALEVTRVQGRFCLELRLG